MVKTTSYSRDPLGIVISAAEVEKPKGIQYKTQLSSSLVVVRWAVF